MLRFAIFVATGLLVGCPSKQPEAPRVAADTALRIRIAHAEARRAGGVQELTELARSSDVHARELALRGLGRVGGAQSVAVLEQALEDRDTRVVAAALYAIGVLASLDEDPAWKPGPKLVAVLPRAPLAALEALGRAGDASSQRVLVARVADPDPVIASAAALALGRHGRRKIAWAAEARAALAHATRSADASLRYAATYALSREHEPPADEAVDAALVARIGDDEAETRATAIAGLAKRKAITAGRKQIEAALRDRDWRVAVEAVRALAEDAGDDAGRVAVAAAMSQRWGELAAGDAIAAQIVTEGLRTLAAHATSDPRLLHAVTALEQAAAADKVVPLLDRGWSSCLSAIAIARLASPEAKPSGTAPLDIDRIAHCSDALPDHLRLPLLTELIKAPLADARSRRATLRILLAHDDPRVRAAGLTVLSATWPDGDASSHATTVGTVTSALTVKNAIVAGTAVDVAGEFYDLLQADDPLRAPLDAAILSRAKTETDVELSASLYALIGKRTLLGGGEVCRAGLTGAPARAKAAADCLHALGEPVPPTTMTPSDAPPGDVASVIGKQLFWHLATTRGEIVIELRPDSAPWAVASIVALTSRGFYNGLEFHRVVPNFVVQGGDPTMSGWGGPGYTLPAEPASSADGTGYIEGGVGIADAGRDSGGSQWFIMHSRAPHLDGRYTWIGRVVSGQKSADALLIGDRVERATIEQR